MDTKERKKGKKRIEKLRKNMKKRIRKEVEIQAKQIEESIKKIDIEKKRKLKGGGKENKEEKKNGNNNNHNKKEYKKSKQEEQWLKIHEKYEIKRVPGNGHCQYVAIGEALKEQGIIERFTVDILRKKVMENVKNSRL